MKISQNRSMKSNSLDENQSLLDVLLASYFPVEPQPRSFERVASVRLVGMPPWHPPFANLVAFDAPVTLASARRVWHEPIPADSVRSQRVLRSTRVHPTKRLRSAAAACCAACC